MASAKKFPDGNRLLPVPLATAQVLPPLVDL
jgi:hypothetical protein